MLAGGYANLLLVMVQGLVLVPLYLRALGPATYGAWMASGDVLGWLAVLDMGVAGVSTQRMAAAHGRGEHRTVADYFGTGVVVQLVLALVLVGLAVLGAPWVPGWVGLHGAAARELSACFAVAGVATGLGLLATVLGTLATSAQRMLFVNGAIFVSGLVGLLTTLALLLDGRGLWALALGMLARSALLVLAVGGHAAYVLRSDLGARARVRWVVAREYMGLSRVAVVTMLSNAAVGRSDALLIALFFGPVAVTPYVLTRRAAELLAMFLARIGGAVYPGFAHLVGSGNHVRAAQVLAQVGRIYFVVAVPAVALYLALNRSFVALWVGSEQFAGGLVTLLVGMNVLVVGWAGMLLFLVGATGDIPASGRGIFIEALLRMGVGLSLLALWGVPGLPLAGVVTSAGAAYLTWAWLYRRLGGPRPGFRARELVLCGALLAAGAAAGTARWGTSWKEFAAWGVAFGAVAAAVVLASEPAARGFARRLLARVRRRPEAAS
jgi:O-antigen/teichoic acid export membrane protein